MATNPKHPGKIKHLPSKPTIEVPDVIKESERKLCIYAIENPDCITELAGILSAKSWSDPCLSRIMLAVYSLHRKGIPIVISSIREEILKEGCSDYSGLLIELSQNNWVTIGMNWQYHAEKVNEYAKARDLKMAFRDTCGILDTEGYFAGTAYLSGLLRDIDISNAKLSDYCIDYQHLMDAEFPERHCIAGDWLTEASLNMIFGARGLGKSFLCMELAISVASGETFMGQWECVEPKGVLYIDGEMPAVLFRSRLKQIQRGRDLSKLKILLSEILYKKKIHTFNINEIEHQQRLDSLLNYLEEQGEKPSLSKLCKVNLLWHYPSSLEHIPIRQP